MVWNPQGYFKKKVPPPDKFSLPAKFNTPSGTTKFKIKGSTEEGVSTVPTLSSPEARAEARYAEAFLKDWEKCRTRHTGQKEVQDAFFSGQFQYIFVQAGRKFSKTTNLIDIAWKYCNLKANRVCYLGYPTIAQGIEVVWEERRLQKCDVHEEFMFDGYVEKTDDSRHILKFRNGSYIKLIGTWSEARGRGSQPDLLLFDEVQDCSPSYIEAMDSNLAAKNSPCVMSGTPSQKPGHYQEWRERIRSNPKGKVFKFTSYDNLSLPHLKEWLDTKKKELIKANKEDVWLREYMADDCFSSSERILPDPIFEDKATIVRKLSNFDFNDRIPVLAISVYGNYLCAVLAIVLLKKTIFIMDKIIIPQVWCRSFTEIYTLLEDKIKESQDLCGHKMRNLVWDESHSFSEIVQGFSNCRKDLKWQDRGIPLLRELMLKKTISFSQEIGDFGLECQNMLIEDSVKDVQMKYPNACTLSMLVNEFFQVESVNQPFYGKPDKLQALRDMGIVCPRKRDLGLKIFRI